MNKRYLCLFFLVPVLGCAPIKPTPSVKPPVTAARPVPGVPEQPAVNEPEVPVNIGTVFAKTVFEGIVKASYVELLIVDQAAPDKTYQLIIGDKERQKSFPWDVQTVRPGYFFIELSEGAYRIQSITIPVGTKRATEAADITFDVQADRFFYLGTLIVNGTKEKVKLGGVPLLQPGFEYNVRVIDEETEAREEFQKRYPESKEGLAVRLMKAVVPDNTSLSEQTATDETLSVFNGHGGK